MEYNDEAMPSLSSIEEMAKAYGISLREKGFVFINFEEEGKNLLLEETLDLLFKLRASYRGMGKFMDSNSMLLLTEKHIDFFRTTFNLEQNRGYFATNNKTKCFVNSIALENNLFLKLLLLSQKCEFGKELVSIIIERTKMISQNLQIDSAIINNKF